jgi:hypothetical protein
MIFCCNKCEKPFKTNWQLQRHLSKKNPCYANHSQKELHSSQRLSETDYEQPNYSQIIQQIQEDLVTDKKVERLCNYCMKEFVSKQTLQKHQKRCKERYDDVRCLEIKLNIPIEPWSNKKCRFCNEYQSEQLGNVKRHHKTCKARTEYKRYLERQEQKSATCGTINNNNTTINNTTNNNNSNNTTINNNLIVNAIGQEDLSYMTCEVIKGILKSTKSPQEFVVKTLAFIHGHEDHPENHNIIYSNYRSNSALVKCEDKFEFKNINTVLKEATCNWLDKVCIDDDYDELPMRIKKKYENVCEDDDLDQTTKSMIKLDLYSKHKNGIIKSTPQ